MSKKFRWISGENSGDIFKVGSVDSGKKDRSGNTIWVSAFSLTKPMLNKLAMAAGIQFNQRKHMEKELISTHTGHRHRGP